MFVVIMGCGRVGSSLARALVRVGHEVTVIDRGRRAVCRSRGSGQVDPGGADAGNVGAAQGDPAQVVFLHAVVERHGGAVAAAGDGAADAVGAHDDVLAVRLGGERRGVGRGHEGGGDVGELGGVGGGLGVCEAGAGQRGADQQRRDGQGFLHAAIQSHGGVRGIAGRCPGACAGHGTDPRRPPVQLPLLLPDSRPRSSALPVPDPPLPLPLPGDAASSTSTTIDWVLPPCSAVRMCLPGVLGCQSMVALPGGHGTVGAPMNSPLSLK
nr:NAD-binding protein [Nocardia farcinica]